MLILRHACHYLYYYFFLLLSAAAISAIVFFHFTEVIIFTHCMPYIVLLRYQISAFATPDMSPLCHFLSAYCSVTNI